MRRDCVPQARIRQSPFRGHARCPIEARATRRAVGRVNTAASSPASPEPADRVKRVLAWAALALLVGIVLLALALRIALRPEFATRLILDRAGAALGLEIAAGGPAGLRLRGTPQLVVRGVVAREPGSPRALLRADRIAIAVPWSTIRARGAALEVERIELDAPVLDLAALQAWLAGRPAGDGRMPTLRKGLAIERGRLLGGDWSVDGLRLDLPRLFPDRPVAAHAAGRYRAARLRLDFDLRLAMARPRLPAGTAAVGRIAAAGADWRLPAWIHASGPLRDERGLRLLPARVGLSGRYASGDTRLPFALGLHGPLLLRGGTVAMAPAGVALRGQGALPSFEARGAFAYGERLLLRLEGRLPRWNDAWPALPPPVGQSNAPLPFRLGYLGAADFGDVADLRLARDDARFEGRFRLPDILAWADAAQAGSPLPPLRGRLSAPALQISGARLEGVEVEFDDSPADAAP